MKYLVKVFEASYKDNWENGEIFNSYNKILMYQTETEDLKKAIEDFKHRFCHHDMKLYITDGMIHTDFTADVDPNSEMWIWPTEKKIESWKKGEVDLWDVEFQMHISKIEDVTTKDIIDAVGKDINIEED